MACESGIVECRGFANVSLLLTSESDDDGDDGACTCEILGSVDALSWVVESSVEVGAASPKRVAVPFGWSYLRVVVTAHRAAVVTVNDEMDRQTLRALDAEETELLTRLASGGAEEEAIRDRLSTIADEMDRLRAQPAQPVQHEEGRSAVRATAFVACAR